MWLWLALLMFTGTTSRLERNTPSNVMKARAPSSVNVSVRQAVIRVANRFISLGNVTALYMGLLSI